MQLTTQHTQNPPENVTHGKILQLQARGGKETASAPEASKWKHQLHPETSFLITDDERYTANSK